MTHLIDSGNRAKNVYSPFSLCSRVVQEKAFNNILKHAKEHAKRCQPSTPFFTVYSRMVFYYVYNNQDNSEKQSTRIWNVQT